MTGAQIIAPEGTENEPLVLKDKSGKKKKSRKSGEDKREEEEDRGVEYYLESEKGNEQSISENLQLQVEYQENINIICMFCMNYLNSLVVSYYFRFFSIVLLVKIL